MSAVPLTRRDASRLGGAAAASVLLAPVGRARAAAWKEIPIATQLWCVRKQLANDIPGTLKAVGALGYQAVELENAFAGPVPSGRALLGHDGPIRDVAVSPDGQWVASAGDDGTVRLWPMPDVTEPPLHTLPYQELLGRLRALTNLRAVEDAQSPGAYRVDAGSFPGWETAPTW